MILHPVNVATPEVAVTELSAQARLPSPEATARVTGSFESVTVLPLASSMVTTGWVVKAVPLTAPAGWVVTDRWVAAPGAKVSVSVVVLVRSVADAVRV